MYEDPTDRPTALINNVPRTVNTQKVLFIRNIDRSTAANVSAVDRWNAYLTFNDKNILIFFLHVLF